MAVEALETREMLTIGVSAQLSRGVLSVVGVSPKAPIVIDVLTMATRRAVTGTVVVEGVGTYRASDVRLVVVREVKGEPVVIHRGRSWNPQFLVTPPTAVPLAPRPTTTTPTPKPTPKPTPTPLPIVVSTGMSADEQAIVDKVNAVRKQNGLAPLSVNLKLVKAAKIHANDMARSTSWPTTSPRTPSRACSTARNYVGYNFSTIGENIAFNYSDTDAVMTGWMNSPGHRANILGGPLHRDRCRDRL